MAFDLVGKAVKNLRLPTTNYNNSSIHVIPAQEGDVNSRYLSISLFDDRGDILLSNYKGVTLYATLPDGTLQKAKGEVDTKKNVAICKISGSMLTQRGKVSCDVRLDGNDSNGEGTSLTSQTFYVLVSKSQYNDSAIEGDDELSTIDNILQSVTETSSKCANAFKKKLGARVVAMSDVSPIEHTVRAKVYAAYGKNIDLSTVTVTRYGVDETDNLHTYTPKADGTLEFPSLSPKMAVLTDTEDACIEVEYNQDSNSVREQIMTEIGLLDDHVNYSLDYKVNKIEPDGEFCQLYGIDETGAENNLLVDLEEQAHESHIPIRNANLSIYIPNAPEEGTDAVNKAYVDGLIGDISTILTALHEGGIT